MASPSKDGAPAGEAPAESPERPSESAGQAPQPSPYDDLLCTICGLKACWMTPEAAGKRGGQA